MTEEYKPTKGEIAAEMRKDLGRSIPKFAKDATGMTLFFNTIPYIIPTFVRMAKEPDGSSEECSEAVDAAHLTGMVLGLAGWVGQAVGYTYLYDHGYGEAPFGPCGN